MSARENITEIAFPTTAPTSGQTGYALTPVLTVTSPFLKGARRCVLTLRSSHDSAASGLKFLALNSGSGTTYRLFTAYSHLAATATNPMWIYDIALPLGILGFQITYDNSASVLTSWEGSIAFVFDERAAP